MKLLRFRFFQVFKLLMTLLFEDMGCKFVCYDLWMTLVIQSHISSFWTQLVSHEGETVRTSCDGYITCVLSVVIEMYC